MFSWLFGKKEEQKKVDKDNSAKIDAGHMWMYDCLTQYLNSPLWRIPIVDFLEANCIYFEDEEENKFEYTKIFQEFRTLVAGMVDNMVKELGISDDLLERCLNKGLRSNHRKLFEQILVVDNFMAFKRIMIKKNKELEMEAMKQIMMEKGASAINEKINELELERLEMEKAIAMSMAIKEKIDDDEEKMIQEAIRLSELEEQKRIEAEQAKQPKPVQEPKPAQKPVEKTKQDLTSLSSLPPLVMPSVIRDTPIVQLKKQSEQITEELTKLKKEQKSVDVEDSQARKKRLQEQRELLRKKKQEERNEQLKQFVEGKQTETKEQPKVSEDELERRRNLMKKLKQQLE